ncbi:MAG: TonB-dependent receptor [Bacteroidales bacterium]|nr:TonB-dependent receptor [Bacteroidales bacterium]
MMLIRHTTLLLLLLFAAAAMGQSYTIRGTVTDKSSGETLIGATIYDKRSGKGTVTNSYGRYSLTLPKDSVDISISFVGYSTQRETFLLDANREINAVLNNSVELQAVEITGERVNGVRSSQTSALNVPIEHIKAVPVIFGETDILKVIQLLPGVQSGTEGMSGMYVRGGGPDENLFLLDGVPLYNVNHLGGFFSAFNSDAIKDVTLYKGSFPARFGGRLSSVLDVTSNNGNDKKIHGNASIGLISAKVNVEGPIVKEKTTFSVSLRRTYFDLITRPVIRVMGKTVGDDMTGGYFFYDFNAKVTHKFSNRSRLFASYYMGDDRIFARVRYKYVYDEGNYNKSYNNMGYNWGNIVASLRWNYELTPKLFMNLTGSYTRYRNIISLGLEEEQRSDGVISREEAEMTYRSGIGDISMRADFDFAPSPEHVVKFGGNLIHHIFTPDVFGLHVSGSADINQNIDTTYYPGGSKLHANEINAYIEDDWTINETVKLNAGLHLSSVAVQDTFYPSIQPRLSGRLIITDDFSFKVGYAYMKQYMHLLSSSNIALPTDLWVPVTKHVQPMGAHQMAAGLFYNWRNLVDLSVEGYYKSMNNLLEYKDGASFWNSRAGWENKVAMGKGWAYGVEFLAQKNVGKWTGWLGYTWSKTMRHFDRKGMELNNGNVFPAKYDRRHDINVVIMYKPNERFDISGTWVYSTGNAVTLAMQYFEGSNVYEGGTMTYEVPYVESRNNYRMPSYHRMDLGVNFHKEKKHGVRTWSISVYNVYNRKNPFLIYTDYGRGTIMDDGTAYSLSLMKASLFPIIPSVSYNFKF